MDLIVQLCLIGFGAALYLYLVAQLPGGASPRWWFFASGVGLLVSILEWMTAEKSVEGVESIIFLCLCAQLGCIARGLVGHRVGSKSFWSAVCRVAWFGSTCNSQQGRPNWRGTQSHCAFIFGMLLVHRGNRSIVVRGSSRRFDHTSGGIYARTAGHRQPHSIGSPR